jgi:hypothetical protein
MSAKVIVLAERLSTESEPQLTADETYLARLFYGPAFIALPFVTLKKKEERKGGFGDAETYWNDVPTDDACADNVRGRAYAKMAVAAINADKCHVPRGLQLTFEHIFLDAVRRREKGGKYSRSLTPAAYAFLNEIAKVIDGRAKDIS